jgi:hypothetical protein
MQYYYCAAQRLCLGGRPVQTSEYKRASTNSYSSYKLYESCWLELASHIRTKWSIRTQLIYYSSQLTTSILARNLAQSAWINSLSQVSSHINSGLSSNSSLSHIQYIFSATLIFLETSSVCIRNYCLNMLFTFLCYFMPHYYT